MPLEDYTTYTEVEPDDRIQKTANHIDFVSERDEDAYLYKDQGTDHFGDFEHWVDCQAPSLGDNSAEASVWGVANAVNDHQALDPLIAVRIQRAGSGGAIYLVLVEEYSGENWDSYAISTGTTYYLKIKKSGTTCTCEVYSNSSRTSLLDTLDISPLGADHKFRYIYGCATWNGNLSNMQQVVDIDNLDLQEGEGNLSSTLWVGAVGEADFSSKALISNVGEADLSSQLVVQQFDEEDLPATFVSKLGIVFEDGFEFEDDNFNTNWDGKNETDAGCSCTIDTTRPKFGSKCAKGTTDGVYKNAFAWKDWGTGLSEVWVRDYVNLENLPSSGTVHFHLAIRDTNNSVIIQAGFRRATGDGVYQCAVWNEVTSSSYLSGSITLNADTWYCYETRLKRGDTDGEVQVWLDGVSEINESSKDTSLGYDYDQIQCGNRASEEASTIYVDAVMVADAYIGMHDIDNLSSTFNAGPLWIISVQAVPGVVIRTGVNTTELRCDFHDEHDLAANQYYCNFWVREPDNSTTYGPFKGSVTKEGSKEYNATYDADPQDGWALGDYDVQAEVYR